MIREHKRSRSIRRLGLPGGATEPSFDRFVERAAEAFNAPIAVLSLADDARLWLKAAHGMPAGAIMPRSMSFCTNVLDGLDVLEACDPLADARFRNLPAVVEAPHIRYYLGAPLCLAGGIGVGALCVVDVRVRPPASPDQRAYLMGLARQASLALEWRNDHMVEPAR